MRDVELAVIGGGPAGIAAAVAASQMGVAALLLDENEAPGGQVYRAPGWARALTRAAREPGHKEGERLRRALAASKVEAQFGRRVWWVSPELEVAALGPDGLEAWRARALVVAVGTTERVVPFPGWTEPGVIGLGAATNLLKAEGMAPGRRTLVAGCGPLLAAVGAGILDAGGEVAGVVDLATNAEWRAALPALAFRPDLLLRGLRWAGRLRRAGVRRFPGHAVRGVKRGDTGLVVEIGPLDGGALGKRPRERIVCDALAVGHGLVPASEVTRMLGLAHEFDAERGGWIARRNARMATSRPDIFVAGDGGGISGAAAALIQGRIAGLAAATALGRLDERLLTRWLRPLAARLRRAERFGRGFAPMFARAGALLAAISEATVVCRCEDVTRGAVEAAIAAGAREVNQVKAWTRAGMGPCQGRVCGDTVGALVAARVKSRQAAGSFTARAPFRPLPVADLIGSFEYADIPIPPPAPP